MTSFNVPGLLGANTASRYLKLALNRTAKTLEQMASGLAINRAADDPAGLSISETMRSQVRGLNREAMNAMDMVSMLQVADSGMGEISGALQEVRELAVYAGSPILTGEDRAALQAQVDQQLEHIDSIAANTKFNTKSLLDGQLGMDASSASLGLAGLDITDPAAASAAISTVDAGISQAGMFRSELGAGQNRIESAIRSLDITMENTMVAESRIRDLDYGEASVKLAASQFQAFAAISAITQANIAASAVLALL